MSERKWTLLEALAYLYNAFATLADGKLDDSEIKEMAFLLTGWTPGEENDIEQVSHIIVEARERLSEDIKGSSDEKDLVNETLSFCLDFIKEIWEEQQYISVIQDMINIGLADGNYDASEQGWVEMVADKLGIDPPSVEQAMDERGRDTADDDIEEDNDYDEDKWSYHVLPKHWKDEHVISCLVRWFMTLETPVAQSEMDWMGKIGGDYAAEGLDVPGVWDGVDEEILKIASVEQRYHLLINDAIIYVDINFDKDKKQTLLNYLNNMIAQTDIVEYQEYMALKSCVNFWFPGQLDSPLANLKSGGIKVITKDPLDSATDSGLKELYRKNNHHFAMINAGKKLYEDFKEKLLENGNSTKEDWNIIHDIGVFYMFFANLAGMKEPEQDFIDEMLPKWNFGIDGINYGFSHGNPSDLNRTMSDIFIYLYGEDGKEDPSDKVGKSHKNLAMYFNDGEKPGKGSFTLGNLQTFLDTLYNLCLADGNVSPAQKDQLTVCCKQWQSVSGHAETILEKLDGKTIDEMFEATEFDTEGRPIEKTDDSDNTDVPKEKTVSRKKTKKAKPKKKLTLHEQLASELAKLYPNSEVKKINEGNKLDIHLPDVNNKKGTHICFNCAKTGEIKIHFYSRDKLFNEDIVNNSSGILEETSGRIRLIGYPSFKTVKDAIKSAEGFIKLLSGSSKLKKEETKKSKPKKKLTVQGQLVEELSKLYPNADVKKVDDGNYLDIHMPDIHPKRGTHIWFNTPKSGGIKVGFFCRDKGFIEDAIKRNPSKIETYANGLRLSGHPTYNEVSDAIKAADEFVKMLKK